MSNLKNLLSAADLDRDFAIHLLDVAEGMADVNDREIKKLPTLRGKTVVNLFFEDSTRTRISFELAAKRLSADVINFSAKGSSVSKGESLKDTVARVLPYYCQEILPRVLNGERVIVAAHGNSLRALTMALEQLTQETVSSVEISTADLIIYKLDDDGKILSKKIYKTNQ